ncbi:MAG: acetate/propionate family kinase [Candidatus Paceibacterota bacterium]
MKILVLNIGSFTFKWELFDEDLVSLKKGNNDLLDISIEEKLKLALEQIGDTSEIKSIGHRVVHGGREFVQTTEIKNENILNLEKYNPLAPLHNPYNVQGIKASLKLLTGIPNFAVFDTAFYKDLPEVAKTYALPLKYYNDGIQKYGFHGISHQYVAEEAAQHTGKAIEECNLITIHLGGGSSITAIKNGKAIDTSMGFTPLEGLVMGTRCGDIDAGIILKLIREDGLSIDRLDDLLNKESGVKALSGFVDFRDVLKAREGGDRKAKLAFDVFVYHIKKYIGAYFAILGNIDAIVFTGSIGSGIETTRNEIVNGLEILKGVPVFAIPSGENIAIAKEAKRCLANRN